MLEIQPAGQRGRTATGSGRKAAKLLPAPLQRHSPGASTTDIGLPTSNCHAWRGYRLAARYLAAFITIIVN